MGKFSLPFSYWKVACVCLWGRKSGVALGVCERKKRWCLLASQTGVILLATPLLFLPSYLISVLPLIGWDGWEKKIRRQRLCRIFFSPFCRLLHRKRYWKPFMVQFLLFHLLICLEQLRRERTLDTDKHMLNVSCLYVALQLKYKAGVLLEWCSAIRTTSLTSSAAIYCKQENLHEAGQEKARVQRSPSFLHFRFLLCRFSLFPLLNHSLDLICSGLIYWFLGWETRSLLFVLKKKRKNGNMLFNSLFFIVPSLCKNCVHVSDYFFFWVKTALWCLQVTPDYKEHLTGINDWYLIFQSKHTPSRWKAHSCPSGLIHYLLYYYATL